MKVILIFLVNIGVAFASFSQTDSTQPVYLRFPNIPEFTIYKAADSTAFTKEDLKKKPSVFIVFSPDCEHCQHETELLIANIDKFKNSQIIMVTYLPYEEMVKFYNDYKIPNYPQIIMGRDVKFFFPVFFNVRNLPSIFVYDKKGKFKKSFEGSVSIDKIAAEL